MLNSHKLLFILPDVTYVTELLPGKKEHSFIVQSFRQINGEFLDDNEFIASNIEKLISKLDAEEYTLVLPDFLFTNTIVESTQTSEAKVKEYIKDSLLPSLELSKDTHEIKAFVLTQHGGKTKIQLSALEKDILSPVVHFAAKRNIIIKNVVSLSWITKSVISLEPSISIVQMGSRVYLAQHYIGIDQTNDAAVSEVENLAETIKTLKGAEPSIQTIYLLTNGLVEEKLKEHLSNTLPLQQLALFKEEDSQMPSYVKQIIEAGMKTLSIPEYAAPLFSLPKPEEVPEPTLKAAPVLPELDLDDDDVEELPPPTPAPDTSEKDVLPVVGEMKELALDDDSESDLGDTDDNSSVANLSVTQMSSTTITFDPGADKDEDETREEMSLEHNVDEAEEQETKESDELDTEKMQGSLTQASPISTEPSLSNFAAKAGTVSTTTDRETQPEELITTPLPTKRIIKNQSNVGGMFKMLFISLAVFFATVAIGVGLGIGFITLSERQTGDQPSPTPSASTSPSPSPTATPTPAPEVKKEEVSVLVVNATTKAGYAGTVKGDIEDAGYTKVSSGNAKGEYDEGNYILMKEEDEALINSLEKATGLELTFSDKIITEDPSNKYQAVVVLAK